MSLERIFVNNKKCIQDKLSTNKNYFKKLSEGQHPKILYIGCSDGRVSAGELMEIFS